VGLAAQECGLVHNVRFRLMVDMGLCLLKGIKGIITLFPLSV